MTQIYKIISIILTIIVMIINASLVHSGEPNCKETTSCANLVDGYKCILKESLIKVCDITKTKFESKCDGVCNLDGSNSTFGKYDEDLVISSKQLSQIRLPIRFWFKELNKICSSYLFIFKQMELTRLNLNEYSRKFKDCTNKMIKKDTKDTKYWYNLSEKLKYKDYVAGIKIIDDQINAIKRLYNSEENLLNIILGWAQNIDMKYEGEFYDDLKNKGRDIQFVDINAVTDKSNYAEIYECQTTNLLLRTHKNKFTNINKEPFHYNWLNKPSKIMMRLFNANLLFRDTPISGYSNCIDLSEEMKYYWFTMSKPNSKDIFRVMVKLI